MGYDYSFTALFVDLVCTLLGYGAAVYVAFKSLGVKVTNILG